MITLYADGSAYYKTRIGGYGVVLRYGDYYRELYQGFNNTTNNRMELMGVIAGLEALKNENQTITVYSDSEYVVNPINSKWLKRWIKNNFNGISNGDLWRRFYEVYKKHNVTMVWVKGHSGIIDNERCDILASKASKKDNRILDMEF